VHAERARGFDVAGEFYRDDEFDEQRDASDLTKSRLGGAAAGLELDFVHEYGRPIVCGIRRGAERYCGDFHTDI
jgi:hypothetical protein